VDVAHTDHHSGLFVMAVLPPRFLLVLASVLVLEIVPRLVLVLRPQPVLVVVLGLHLLQTVSDEVSLLATLKASL
jgi:hypothetical protein